MSVPISARVSAAGRSRTLQLRKTPPVSHHPEVGRTIGHRQIQAILGGDNLDLALAHHLEPRLAAGVLDRRQWSVLIHRSRQAKETLLGRNPPERSTITVPGGGSKLLGGALSAELRRDEALELLVEGFLPRVPLSERPAPRASGFRELGLPYAPDSGITRYLAKFLSSHAEAAGAGAGAGAGAKAVRPDVLRRLCL